MKKAKKILSVVLVLVMALSMMSFASANPADKNADDYPDFDQINSKYVEAVDVLTALGILTGRDDGDFDPTDSITRAEAAKIITYVLIGKVAADRLGSSPSSFKDVETISWANPFIEYCAANGIIAGYGDGRFGPNDNITAAQMAKMLLIAAGYGAKDEYIGDRWQLNAIVDGQNKKILDTDVDYSAPATREEIANYTFNLLAWVMMVTYNSALDGYYDGSGGNQVWGTSTTPMTLGERTFKLVYATGTDRYGYSTRQWKLNNAYNANSLTNTYRADVTLARSTNGAPLVTTGTNAGLTTVGSANFKARLVPIQTSANVYQNIDFYINGAVVGSSATTTGTVTVPAEADASADKRGVIVDLVDTNFDGHADKVVIIENKAAYVVATPSVNAVTGDVTIAGLVNAKTNTSTFLKNSVVYPEDLKTGDVVLYHQDGIGVTHIKKAEAISGQVTGYSSALYNATFAGTSYTGSEIVRDTSVNAAWNYIAFVSSQYNHNIDATAYLDDNGSIILFKPGETATPDYMVLTAVQNSGFTISGRAIFKDGAIKDIVINKLTKANGTPGTLYDTVNKKAHTDISDLEGTIVTYIIDSNGNYALTVPQATQAAALASQTNRSALMTGVDTTAAGTGANLQRTPEFFTGAAYTTAKNIFYGSTAATSRLYGDEKTVFIVNTNTASNPIRVFTGVRNAPQFTGSTYEFKAQAVTYTPYPSGSTYAKLIYIDLAAGTLASDKRETLMFVNLADFTATQVNNEFVYTTKVVDISASAEASNVKDVTVNAAAWANLTSGNPTPIAPGSWDNYKSKLAEVEYNNGVVSAVTSWPNTGYGFGTSNPGDQVIVLNALASTVAYKWNSSTVVYKISSGSVDKGGMELVYDDAAAIFFFETATSDPNLIERMYVVQRGGAAVSSITVTTPAGGLDTSYDNGDAFNAGAYIAAVRLTITNDNGTFSTVAGNASSVTTRWAASASNSAATVSPPPVDASGNLTDATGSIYYLELAYAGGYYYVTITLTP